MLKIVGGILIALGLIATPLATLVAFGTVTDDDSPYDSPVPYLWIAFAGCCALLVGWRFLRRARDRSGLPDYW